MGLLWDLDDPLLEFLLFTLLLGEALLAFDGFEDLFLYLDELLLLFDLLETERFDFSVLPLRFFTEVSLSLLSLSLFDFIPESRRPLEPRPLSDVLVLSIRLLLLP